MPSAFNANAEKKSVQRKASNKTRKVGACEKTATFSWTCTHAFDWLPLYSAAIVLSLLADQCNLFDSAADSLSLNRGITMLDTQLHAPFVCNHPAMMWL